jgi:hypothetical protein
MLPINTETVYISVAEPEPGPLPQGAASFLLLSLEPVPHQNVQRFELLPYISKEK